MSLYVADKTDSVVPSNGQPALPTKAVADQGGPSSFSTEPGFNLTLLQYWVAVRRHAWHIAIFVAATVLCTGIILLRLPKQYESTAVIRIDPSMPVNVVGNQVGNSGGVDMGALLATDEKEIVSPAVVTPAVLKLGLWKPQDGDSSATVSSAVVAKIAGGIKVSQVRGTYLLDVSYRSTSPSQAAAMANALAEQFIEHEYETRNSALLNLTQYMREQIKELGQRMKESQLALNAFETDNNIINPDNISSQLTQQLSSLQQELGQEQAEQRSLEANLALAKEGNVDALLVSDRGSALAPLLQAQQQAEMEFAALASKYGPGNYLYQQQQRKLARIRDSIQNAQQHVAAQIEAQAKSEAVQVNLTARQFAEVKAQINEFNRKGVQFEILKHKADSDKGLYDDLLKQVDAADVTAGYHSTAMRIVDAASPNPVPVYPRVKLSLLLAFLLAGTMGVVGAVAVSGMDRTLRDPKAISPILGINLLGSLPQVHDEKELKSLMVPLVPEEDLMQGPFAESVLRIRSTLLLGASGGPVRSVAVVSSQPGEGKTTIAANVAAAMAALGKRTVVVDGDLRRPQLHRVLGLSNRLGLSSVLQSQSILQEALLPGPTERLSILPAGPTSANARELIAGRISALVEELKAQFDIVVIDTPPILGFADGLNIATAADTSLLVVRAGRTPREYVQLLIDQLRHVRADLAGIVLNGVTAEMSRHYYYYHDGYGSYYSHKNGDRDV
jgi:polysaccharide biosynthesis transport protein